MIKVVISSHNKIIESKVIRSKTIHIGRNHLSDIVIPDKSISRNLLTIEVLADGTCHLKVKDTQDVSFSEYYEYNVGFYKIQIYNLSLLSDETTGDIVLENKMHKRKFEIIFYSIALIGILVIEYAWLDYRNRDLWKNVQDLVLLMGIALSSSVLLSLLSRAIEGKYNFLKFTALNLQVLCLVSLFNLNFFGARWLLGSWAQYTEIYYSILVLILIFYVFRIGLFVFSHITAHIRWLFIAVALIILLTPIGIKYIPARDNYKYLTYVVKPPLLDLFEEKPVSEDEFLKSLEGLYE